METKTLDEFASKVPAITLGFWVIKILATTLGETGGDIEYWGIIVASTTFGTTLADFFDRSLGIGYSGGSLLLLACLLVSLFSWQKTLGTVEVNTIATPRAESFYWLTIIISQTLRMAWVTRAPR